MHMEIASSPQRRHRERNPVASLIVGFLVAVYGLTLLLDNLGFAEARHYLHQAWPAVFVIIGVTLLIHRDPTRNRYGFWGTAWIVAGLWVYAAQRDWLHASFVPVLLIALGGSFVYRALQRYDDDRQVVLRRY
jgi:hypothetical protein